MLCPICGQDNALGSSRCFNCGTSLVPEEKPARGAVDDDTGRAARIETKFGLVGLAISVVAFQLTVPLLFGHVPGGLDLVRVGAAGIVGALGLVIGRAIGKRRARRDQ